MVNAVTLFAKATRHFMKREYLAAADTFRSAVCLSPERSDLYAHVAMIEHQTGIIKKAIEDYRRSILINKDNLPSNINCGLLCHLLMRYEEAERHFREAIHLNANSSESYSNLGLTLQSLRKLGDAEVSLKKALELNPFFTSAWNNLGNIYLDQGRVDEAIQCFTEAGRHDPMAKNPSFNIAFSELYRQDDPVLVLAQSEFVARRHLNYPITLHQKREHTRPTIGFVSGDLRKHPVGLAVAPVAEYLSDMNYSLFFYSTTPLEDHISRRFRNVGAFVPAYGLDDDELHKRIMLDEIDILVDLAGYTAGNRLEVFARKPAPIQMTWFGYPGTTGSPQMDYLIASKTELDGLDEYFTEKLIKLPHTTVCFEPSYYDPLPSLPFDRNGYITFGSFNVLKKIGSNVITLWSDILSSVPKSKLLMKSPALDCPDTVSRYRQMFSDRGINPERISFLGYSSSEEHQEAMGQVDIALDSFPYAGGVTTTECLWMGLPVITLPKFTYPSRHSSAYLKSIWLDEFIASSPAEYRKKAISLAENPNYLRAIRFGMRDRLLSSPLCNIKKFGELMENVFSSAWFSYISGKSPISFTVKE